MKGRQYAPQLPPTVTGLSAIAEQYDVFAFDQFGVLHDGTKPYPGALKALRELKRRGKRILVLTNSGKQAPANLARLVDMGFPARSLDAVVSSGETARCAIADGTLGVPFIPGARVRIIGKAGDDYGFDGLGLHFVSSPSLADFLLILGSDAPRRSLRQQISALRFAAEMPVPALCANPDLTMLTRAGPQPAPGAIAAGYAALGGPVTFVGKPYPAIYQRLLAVAGPVPPERILAIGDSLHHDIAGAKRAGLAALLVRTGVSAGLDDIKLAAAIAAVGAVPDALAPELAW